MLCPRCGAENRATDRFCHQCGAPLRGELSPPFPPSSVAPPRSFPIIPWARAGCFAFFGGMVLCLLYVFIWLFFSGPEEGRSVSCQVDLKSLSSALLIYAQDYDGKLPPSSRWADATLPYFKSEMILRCPSDSSSWPLSHDYKAHPHLNGPPSYAYNVHLSGRPVKEIPVSAETVALFDSMAGVLNAADGGSSLVRPGRHLRGNNLAFVDGHAQWLPDRSITPDLFDLQK